MFLYKNNDYSGCIFRINLKVQYFCWYAGQSSIMPAVVQHNSLFIWDTEQSYTHILGCLA